MACQHSGIALVAALGLAACGGGGGSAGDDDDHPMPDASTGPQAPPWWQPKPGDAKNWDIQFGAPIDVSAPRAMYDLDLWSLVPAPTMLDYGDGKPAITVPAGALAGKIAELHARTPPAIVICHVETGALDLMLPDAPKFPGYEANPPNNPTAPKTGSAIGWSVSRPTQRWLDIRAASRAAWLPIMFKRFELAKQIGCDGVDPDRNPRPDLSTGFTLTAQDSYSWYGEIATQGHARMLSTGMKNGYLLAGQVDVEAPRFDWLMVERCGENNECDAARPFIALNKAVFAIEYTTDVAGDPLPQATLTAACSSQNVVGIVDNLIKDAALTSSVRMQCP